MQVSGFTAKRGGRFIPLDDDGVYVTSGFKRCQMRPNQRHVFNHFRDERLMVVIQPPGSGKSTLVKFVHGYDLNRDPSRKVIVAVPQTIIAKTFRAVELVYDDGTTIEWEVNDLCAERQESKVDDLVRFLRKTTFPKGISERAVLCTHTTLALAYAHLKENGANVGAMFKNTTFVLDEGHHVLDSTSEDEDSDLRNKLGDFCHEFMKVNDPTAKLWFPTGTFFRGDKLSIIKSDDYSQFKSHYLPLDKHWQENIRHIQSYAFDFVTFTNEPWDEVRSILKRGKRKTIFYVPMSHQPVAKGCKYEFTKRLKDLIYECWGADANVLDLVDESGRDDRKAQLEDERQSLTLDAVISISMVNEGTDWPSAEQIIDLNPSNSLRIMVQRFGRLIRDLAGKLHLNYYMMLPFTLSQLDHEEFRRALNNNFAAFTASMLIEDCIRPIEIPQEREGDEEPHQSPQPSRNYFREHFPDENRRREIIEDVSKALLTLRGEAEESQRTLAPDEIREHVEFVLRQSGATEHAPEIAKVIVAMLRRRVAASYVEQVDVSWTVDAGFEKIWRDEIFTSLLSFVSGTCSIKTFSEFRAIYATRDEATWTEMLGKAKKLIEGNHGRKA